MTEFKRDLTGKRERSEKNRVEDEDEELEEGERIASLVQKCPNIRILHQIHAHILTRPLPISILSFSLSKLLSFSTLSPHSDVVYSLKLFSTIPNPTIFSWNSLIRGCYHNPSTLPIRIFKKLTRKGNPQPNSFTLSFVLKACSIISAFSEGEQVHCNAIRSGYYSSPFVQTALVNFYAKCEEIGCARKVFDGIPERNVVVWSTMISGYSKLEKFSEALGLFREMQKAGVEPDEVTMVSVISACAAAGALDVGRWVHAYIDKKLIKNDLELSTSLVNMYAKCGCIERAKQVFDEMPVRDTMAWSSMIVGLAIHGLAEEALDVFAKMEQAKVKPNHVTYIGVLSACAHGGLVPEGKKHWSTMLWHGVQPSMEHYGIMVDLFCRTNLIKEAFNFIETMPISPNPVIYRTLLVGCKKNKILDQGQIAANCLLELEPLNAENYILLSSLYASCSKWEEMSQIRKQMKEKGIKPVPGCSSIEVDGLVHEFIMGDRSHSESEGIREVLRDITKRVRGAGHEPGVSAVLHNVGDEEKESDLCEHSERLAIAFGMLKTRAPVVIRVVKNLRVCVDCHEVTKIVSRLYEREIVVRDRVRFHRFVKGACSCKDFW